MLWSALGGISSIFNDWLPATSVTSALAAVEALEDSEADMLRPRLEVLRESLQRCKLAPPQGVLFLSTHDDLWGGRTSPAAADDPSFTDYFQLFGRLFTRR